MTVRRFAAGAVAVHAARSAVAWLGLVVPASCADSQRQTKRARSAYRELPRLHVERESVSEDNDAVE